jgi:hypothetical protein
MFLKGCAAVKFPFQVKLWFTKNHMLTCIFILYIVIGGFNAGYSYYTTIDENNICNPNVYDKNDCDAVLLYRHMLNVLFSCCPGGLSFERFLRTKKHQNAMSKLT